MHLGVFERPAKTDFFNGLLRVQKRQDLGVKYMESSEGVKASSRGSRGPAVFVEDREEVFEVERLDAGQQGGRLIFRITRIGDMGGITPAAFP